MDSRLTLLPGDRVWANGSRSFHLAGGAALVWYYDIGQSAPTQQGGGGGGRAAGVAAEVAVAAGETNGLRSV